MKSTSVSVHAIERKIFLIRGHKVILDSHLAQLYNVPTKRLNEQVKRNTNRFPEDFVFRLTEDELTELSGVANRSQIATGSQKHRDRRFLPFVFTEHGCLMAANVLHSDQAVQMSVYVVRAFLRLREMMSTHKDLQMKIKALERRFNTKFSIVFDAINTLFDGPKRKFRVKGFIKP
jgi:ORF6N domain